MNSTKNWILFLFFSTVLSVYLVIKPKENIDKESKGTKTAYLENQTNTNENQLLVITDKKR